MRVTLRLMPLSFLLMGLLAAGPADTKKADVQPPQNGSASAISQGEVVVDLTDLVARALAGKVELHTSDNASPIVIATPEGRAHQMCPVGKYKACVYVYDAGVPFLVAVEEIEVQEHLPASVLLNLAYGVSGHTPLQSFDRDYDLAIDSVEDQEKTNPDDPASMPFKPKLEFEAPVLSKDHGWFRGELHAHSSFGGGSETVAQLVKRAEKSGLDFLAITDRNTLAACNDPGFRSNKVALIPAMEWGSEKEGVALIYGPRTFPEPTSTREEAQALLRQVQAQGGIFAIAHPCFPTAPWQWGLAYVNAVEVWCRDWSAVPPMTLDALGEFLKVRQNNKLVYSIAQAAGITQLSANGQACAFWDNELNRQLHACALGGSGSASPKVRLGAPVTYVYAKDKSWPAIVEGIRLGRTYVSEGLDGPTIQFCADVQKDGKIDVALGGVIPLGVETELQVVITRAKGKKLEVLRNGLSIIAQTIESSNFMIKFSQTPLQYSVYRVQVIDAAPPGVFGRTQVLAVSSPIYFDDVILVRADLDPERAWIRVENQYQEEFYPDMFVPPSQQQTIEPQWVH